MLDSTTKQLGPLFPSLFNMHTCLLDNTVQGARFGFCLEHSVYRSLDAKEFLDSISEYLKYHLLVRSNHTTWLPKVCRLVKVWSLCQQRLRCPISIYLQIIIQEHYRLPNSLSSYNISSDSAL